MTRWLVDRRNGDWSILTEDGRHETHVGPDDRARQWAEWYVSKRNMPADTTDWPLPGLTDFATNDGDAHLFVCHGEPVGTLGWNGLEWWFYGLTFEIDLTDDDPLHIDVDAEQRAAFASEREEIVQAPEGTVRDTRTVELDARIKYHRDETRELAKLRARLEANRIWRERRSS